MHIRFTGDDISHIRQNAEGGTGHGSYSKLHGCPAFRCDRIQPVLFKQLLIQKDKSVYLSQIRHGITVDLIPFLQKLCPLRQILFSLHHDPVKFIDNNGHIDWDYLQSQLLHQLPFVVDDGAERFRPHADLADPHSPKVFDNAGNPDEALQPFPEFFILHRTVFDIAEGDVQTLQLSRNSKYTALAVRIPCAVRLKYVIQRRPEQHRHF